MGVLAEFEIVDYDGQNHSFYRFGDGHPYERHGVFANFPLGDRDFLLGTYVRRLNLQKSQYDYFVDVFYKMDLRSRRIEVSSKCFEDCDFKGTFEEAIRHFAWDGYVEKDVLSKFPKQSDLEPILVPGFLKGAHQIIEAVCDNFPFLKKDLVMDIELLVGDTVMFYMYDDFIMYPITGENLNAKAIGDAYCNARRVGVRLFFNNKISGKRFTLLYMLGVGAGGYVLPMTDKWVRYGEGLDEETQKQELLILIEFMKTKKPEEMRALNILNVIGYGKKLESIRASVMGVGE